MEIENNVVEQQTGATVKSNDTGFAMNCEKGNAGNFEAATLCGNQRKITGVVLSQGTQRQVGTFDSGATTPVANPLDELRSQIPLMNSVQPLRNSSSKSKQCWMNQRY